MSTSGSDTEHLFLLSDLSDTESDNTRQRVYKERVNYLTQLDCMEFQMRFRLDKPLVEQLLVEIYPHLRVKGARNYGVTPLHQLLLTLRFYALGTMLLSVADFIGVSKTSACRIVRDVSGAIAALYAKYIFIKPDTEREFLKFRNSLEFLERLTVLISEFNRHALKLVKNFGTERDYFHRGRPRCGGRVISPFVGPFHPNRKGYFSLNVQAVCDANLLFMNVVARWPGSAHDATIFNNSVLRAQCESGQFANKWLLGDSAYPLRSYLLTPLLAPQTRGQKLYNDAHIRTRNCIERCFGLWKRRFPVVALTLRLSLLRANAVIVATAILHNICRMKKLQDLDAEVEIPEPEPVPTSNYNEDHSVTITSERELLITQDFNNL